MEASETSSSLAQRRLWFLENQGAVAKWKDLSQPDLRLVSAPKGIYKPAESRYALSVRIMRDSPYADGRFHWQGDEWAVAYHQEGADPGRRDDEYTNVALMNCMRDRQPVGVLRERSSRTGGRVKYDVLGLACVSTWADGYFFLAGPAALEGNSALRTDVLSRVVEAEAREVLDDSTLPADDYDARVRALRAIVARQGQSKFRRAVRAHYGDHCVISGCNVPAVLDAAHITPYRGPASDTIANALLLRTDLHTLFDKALLAIHPEDGAVKLSKELIGTSYETLDGSTALAWGRSLGDDQRASLAIALRYYLDVETGR